MGAYEYQAVDSEGKTQKGMIEADTAKQARQQLRGMSLMPVEIGEVSLARLGYILGRWYFTRNYVECIIVPNAVKHL